MEEISTSRMVGVIASLKLVNIIIRPRAVRGLRIVGMIGLNKLILSLPLSDHKDIVARRGAARVLAYCDARSELMMALCFAMCEYRQ